MAEIKVSESLLAQVWQRQLLREDKLVTSDGEPVRVVYPGRFTNDSGPDFRGGIVTIEGGDLIKGDIELHVRSGDWRSHGHHRDPGYNGVILHVVLWNDTAMPTLLQSGKTAPVLALGHCLSGSIEEIRHWASLPVLSTEPCLDAGERFGDTAVGKLLDDAGVDRFRSKAAFFQAEMGDEEAGQVLYRGIMAALGYTKNKEPFQELACRLPLRVLERLARSESLRRQSLILQAMLFGMAGLLPSQRRKGVILGGNGFVGELELIWHSLGTPTTMSEADWRFFRVRPKNFPTRRIAGISYLLTRYLGKGMLPGILDLSIDSPVGMERGLMVTADGYWAEHFDFGGGGGVRVPTLIGRNRAAEMVVNAILPFFFAWARRASDSGMERRILELYHDYPKLGENEITRQMTRQLFGQSSSRVVSSARRQQGLIHIYKTFCIERKCSQCPLGGASS